MFKKILVPIDGSDHARKALEYALDLAEKYQADLEMLNVVPTVPIAPLAYLQDPMVVRAGWAVPYLGDLRSSNEKMLSETLTNAKKTKPGLNISSKQVEGRPSNKIVEAAKEGNFDLIVMGSRGLGGIEEFFLGSVSDRVADSAECPVMIVK
ncbi:MAG: universal stress protein [Candidatus Bathyarchaeota archaeon]